MRRVDQFWWVLLACAVVLVGVAAMAQHGALDGQSPDAGVLTWDYPRDGVIDGRCLQYRDGELHWVDECYLTVKEWIDFEGKQLGLRSDGVVVWREND